MNNSNEIKNCTFDGDNNLCIFKTYNKQYAIIVIIKHSISIYI